MFDPLSTRRRVDSMEPPEEIEVGRRRELVVEPRRLGQDADPRANLIRTIDDVEPVDRRAPFGRCDERRQQADGRRLARTVGAEEAEDLAPEHLEIHVPDRPQRSERAAQIGGAEHDRVGGGHARSVPARRAPHTSRGRNASRVPHASRVPMPLERASALDACFSAPPPTFSVDAYRQHQWLLA